MTDDGAIILYSAEITNKQTSFSCIQSFPTMITRSRTAQEQRHQQRLEQAIHKYTAEAVQAFHDGLGAVLRQWTALELAVTFQWGGPDSRESAVALQEELFELFLAPEKVYKDDIVLVLEDYLETHFNTICEDGSPEELGELFVQLWRQCCAGDFAMVRDIMSKEATRNKASVVSSSQGLSGGDADDGSDDDDGDGKDLLEEAMGQAMGTILEEEEMGETMETENDTAPPLVDADGWETVVKKGKKSGSKSNKTKK